MLLFFWGGDLLFYGVAWVLLIKLCLYIRHKRLGNTYEYLLVFLLKFCFKRTQQMFICSLSVYSRRKWSVLWKGSPVYHLIYRCISTISLLTLLCHSFKSQSVLEKNKNAHLASPDPSFFNHIITSSPIYSVLYSPVWIAPVVLSCYWYAHSLGICRHSFASFLLWALILIFEAGSGKS